jgi:hypothetical protein
VRDLLTELGSEIFPRVNAALLTSVQPVKASVASNSAETFCMHALTAE